MSESTQSEQRADSGHLGIYCDYGSTLRPETGIGVFVFNLIAALVRVAPGLRITLQVHPGDERELTRLAKRRGWTVGVIPRVGPRQMLGNRAQWHARFARLFWAWESCQTFVELRRIHWPIRFREVARTWLKRLWHAWQAPTLARRAWAVALTAATVGAAPIVWLGVALYFLISEFAAPLILRPAEFVLALARRALGSRTGDLAEAESRVAASVDCDVWLVPYAGTRTRFPVPQIVGVWDLVHHHVPEVFSREQAVDTDRVFAARVRDAALVFCGSRHVLEQDLLRVYGAAADRLRLLPLAAPADFGPEVSAVEIARVRNAYRLDAPYLFYPAGFVAHKNHARLVRALKLLRNEAEFSTLELVLTGSPVPEPLRRLVVELDLGDSVRFLGRVPREHLGALYRSAALTPLVSLHEGYGLPLLEALAHGVPVACAEIPAFRELLAGHHEAALFFDPHCETFIADALRRTLRARSEFVARQEAAWRHSTRRSWDDVARDFLALMAEARRAVSASPHLRRAA